MASLVFSTRGTHFPVCTLWVVFEQWAPTVVLQPALHPPCANTSHSVLSPLIPPSLLLTHTGVYTSAQTSTISTCKIQAIWKCCVRQCKVIWLIMSSKMKVASQHWTDWTDCDNVPNKTKDIFTLLRLKRFLYMIVGCSIPCRVVFAARCACRKLDWLDWLDLLDWGGF